MVEPRQSIHELPSDDIISSSSSRLSSSVVFRSRRPAAVTMPGAGRGQIQQRLGNGREAVVQQLQRRGGVAGRAADVLYAATNAAMMGDHQRFRGGGEFAVDDVVVVAADVDGGGGRRGQG